MILVRTVTRYPEKRREVIVYISRVNLKDCTFFRDCPSLKMSPFLNKVTVYIDNSLFCYRYKLWEIVSQRVCQSSDLCVRRNFIGL